MYLLKIVVVFVIVTLHYAITESGVTLSSDIESEGRTSACQGEVVVYTCRVENTGVLQWAIESLHEIQGDPILFSVGYHPVGAVVHGDGGLFNATLTEVDPIMVYWGNLSSQLTVLAHESLNAKWIWCSNGELSESESPRILHQIGASPSAPLSLSYSIESHDIASYLVTVEWQPPGDSGGIGISNYTTTLRTSHKLHTYIEGEHYLHHLSLSYNQMYSFEVFASNCMGHGPPAVLSGVYAISCGLPELPTLANDTVVDVDSTHEGSTVTFLCADGEEILSIKCMRNGSWTPEPSEINCSVLKPPVSLEGHCQRPETTNHSHIEVDSTAIGGVVTYQCDDGFEPTEKMVTVCSSMGHWVPDTAAFRCTKQVDCGIPAPPTNGSVLYTDSIEGSTAFVQCEPGLALQGDPVSICNGNSRWMPNPASQMCIHITATEIKWKFARENTSGNVYMHCTITGVIVLLVALPLGVVLGILSLKCYKRQQGKKGKKRHVHPPLPVYEEVALRTQTAHVIDLNCNEAYGVHTTQD